ncbi:hypothetical protein L218DRAFT_1007627 [Marasmius fiardii PR-910]|nr:hypothetical protein L218DRAFT_1007627 [Marasmius fiardii PR-910]
MVQEEVRGQGRPRRFDSEHRDQDTQRPAFDTATELQALLLPNAFNVTSALTSDLYHLPNLEDAASISAPRSKQFARYMVMHVKELEPVIEQHNALALPPDDVLREIFSQWLPGHHFPTRNLTEAPLLLTPELSLDLSSDDLLGGSSRPADGTFRFSAGGDEAMAWLAISLEYNGKGSLVPSLLESFEFELRQTSIDRNGITDPDFLFPVLRSPSLNVPSSLQRKDSSS